MNLPVVPTFVATLTLALVGTVRAADPPTIVPLPQKLERRDGSFKLNSGTQLVTDAAGKDTGEFLAGKLRAAAGYPFKLTANRGARPGKGNILLTTRSARTDLGPEGYELTVTADSVIIRAPDTAGLFYGAQTLLQLLPPEIAASKASPNTAWLVPCVRIEDQPRFAWRGLMLDVSRHFFTKEEVKRLLDALAVYKLNTFHWHLVDDHGWRI